MADKKNLKIAILGSRGIPAMYGGFETFVENLSKRLASMGADVTVFCPSDNDYKKSTYSGVKLAFVLNPEKYLGPLGTILYDLFSLLKASFSGFSVVYMLGYSSSVFCMIPKVLNKKVVINTDGLEWKRSKWNFLVRKYLKFSERFATKIADALIADSMSIGKYYRGNYGKDPVYISYGEDVFYSKDQKVLGEFKLKANDYYLVVARLEPENHIHTIIRGFVSSGSRKKLFLITSLKKSKYFDEIKGLVKNDKRVIWYGPLYNREKLREIRANAFAYIHGHSVGGTNPSLLESMATGSPVIAFDVPFNKEVADGGNFYFRDEAGLVGVVRRVERMEAERLRELGERNRRIIKAFYNWDSVASCHLGLFKELSGDRPV